MLHPITALNSAQRLSALTFFSLSAKNRPLRIIQIWRALTVACAFLLFCTSLGAVDSGLALDQYGHTAWRVREGYFSGPLLAIAQTKDGQLWIGGASGLVRFDGVRFLPLPQEMHLPDSRIYSLLGTGDGSLWIGTARGLARWKDGNITVYATKGRFAALLEDRHGTVWAGHTRALEELPPLCSFAAGAFQCFRVPAKSPLRYVGSLEEDTDGNLWVGGEGAVCRWNAGMRDCYEIPVRPQADRPGVYSLATDFTGDLWVDGGPTGVLRLISGRWQLERFLPGPAVESGAMLIDRNGSLWIGDQANGIIRRINGKIDRFTQHEGLTGNAVNKIFEDREGNVWVATSGGLDRFRDVKVVTLSPEQELPLNTVWSVASSKDGGLWISGSHTLVRMNHEGMKTYESGHALPAKSLGEIFEDHRGRLWLGAGSGLIWRDDENRFHEFRLPDDCDRTTMVVAMAEESNGTLWIATTGLVCRLVAIRQDRIIETVSSAQLQKFVTAMVPDPAGGIWLAGNGQLSHYRDGRLEFRSDQLPIQSVNLFVDANGLWDATNEGLVFYRGAKRSVLNSTNGLPCDSIEAAVKDDSGALWLKASCALVQIPPGELAKWTEDPERRVQVRVLDAFDGSQAGSSVFGHHATKTADGRLWFVNDSAGLQRVDPSHILDNTSAPPVKILRIVADHKDYHSGPDLRLQPLTKTLEIEYAAYSLSVPEKVRFRYKLEGYDKSWSAPVPGREVTYANLPPGGYQFRVIASNNDGVWNDTGAGFAFTIPPAFVQSLLFKALCALTSVVVLWIGYRIRVRQVAQRIQDRLYERVDERTRIARDLHDNFFQGIQGLLLRFHTATSQLPALPQNEPARGIFEHALRQSDDVMKEGRELLLNLRCSAADSRHLPGALAEAGRQFQELHPCEFNVIVNGQARACHTVICDELFQIGKEALGNAFRHSGASQIEAEVHYEEGQLRLRVRDNGRGIDPSILEQGFRSGHWGLPGMRERAKKIGTQLEMWSQAGAGMEVELRIPARLAYVSEQRGGSTSWLRRVWNGDDGTVDRNSEFG
jgi:ligand-binding sensor domain-containing protein/signal transduction histidine kinase